MFEDRHERQFYRDPAVVAAFAANVDDGAVVSAAKVTDIGAQQFFGAQPGKQRSENKGAVAFDPIGASLTLRIGVEGSAVTESVGSAFGSVLARLGRPTKGIGLAVINSEV